MPLSHNFFSIWALLFIGNYSLIFSEQTLTYVNQRGSVMVLTWNGDPEATGSLSGTFTTAVGNCKTDVGVPMPLSGFFNGNAIAVTVNFPNCKQVVAMTGNLIDQNQELNTLWLDAHQAADPTRKDWNSNIIGADHYVRQEL